jgi:Fur family ferric uptake transcriptional regulator
MHCSKAIHPADLLRDFDIEATPHRLDILEILLSSPNPLRPRDILSRLQGQSGINKVTVYRNLDLLVEKRVLHRISSGERSFRYGLSPEVLGQPHAHFHCLQCDRLICLSPDDVRLEPIRARQGQLGRIEHVEIRLDGTCRSCLCAERHDS